MRPPLAASRLGRRRDVDPGAERCARVGTGEQSAIPQKAERRAADLVYRCCRNYRALSYALSQGHAFAGRAACPSRGPSTRGRHYPACGGNSLHCAVARLGAPSSPLCGYGRAWRAPFGGGPGPSNWSARRTACGTDAPRLFRGRVLLRRGRAPRRRGRAPRRRGRMAVTVRSHSMPGRSGNLGRKINLNRDVRWN